MRVLEAGSVHTYKMGKNRKHRIRKAGMENESDNSSDDGAAICSHITKAVNFAAMRKTMLKPTVTFGECASCTADASRSGARDLLGSPLEGAAAAALEDSDIEPSIWLCLQCGHQGCHRYSREKHALKHYEMPHWDKHCICVNLTTWSAWCYSCESDIPVENSKRIQECVDFLRKQAGLPRIDIAALFTAQRPIQTASQSDVSPTDHSPPASQSRSDKAQGLSILGNTCFFNAVMQISTSANKPDRFECAMEDIVPTTPEDIALNPFAEGNSLSDLILKVEERKLYVHKLALALVSPVFKALLFPSAGSEFREKDAREMPLPDKKYKDVVNFLIQIYAEHSHQPITDDNLVGVMALADEYQVNYVMDKCQRYVEAQLKDQSKLSTAQIPMYLWISKRYQRLQHSIGTAMEVVVARPIHDIQKCKYYSQLTIEDQNDIIFKRCEMLEKEHAVVCRFAGRVEVAFPKIENEKCNCQFNSKRASKLYTFLADGSKFFLDGQVCSKCISLVARRIASGRISGEI